MTAVAVAFLAAMATIGVLLALAPQTDKIDAQLGGVVLAASCIGAAVYLLLA